MIAKLIVKGKDRTEVIAIAKRALREFHIGGVHSTIPFHLYMLEDENFLMVNLSKEKINITSTQKKELLERIEEETKKTFNFNEEPLFRGLLLEISDNEYILILTFHHIISDEWSIDIFFKDTDNLRDYGGYIRAGQRTGRTKTFNHIDRH